MNDPVIDEIVASIDTLSSFDSDTEEISPQGKTKHMHSARLEMPSSSLYPVAVTAPGNRTNKKKLSTYLKLSLAVTAILLVTSWVISENNSSGMSFNMKEPNGAGDPNSEFPEYASVERFEESETPEQTPYHSYSILVDPTQISAAELLKCPASVINFVINATDAKDECDGLRKAFDKTCSGHGHGDHSGGHERRRLMLEENDNSLHLFGSFKRFAKSITPTLRRKLQEESSEIALQVEDDGEIEEEEEENEEKHISLTLPTATGHMTDEMAEDMLGLNNELSDIAKTIGEIGNKTHYYNSTSHQSASGYEQFDTAAAAAVSAVIHRPEVIEVQSCCRSIIQVFHDECDNPEDEEYADRRLFVIVCVIALCGMIKSLIRHFKIRWLPEAGGCILVGVVGGLFMRILPNIDFAFSHDMFLRVMVPPIVFEAALNINKRSFREMIVPILILALFGTILSTLLTAAIVYYGTAFITHCTRIPFIESLTFGALISSIDPIAVLSVLNNMGMSDKDQIYVIIFGESLLNDGVAIVLFQTLLNFMDENLVIDGEAVYLATLQFLVIAFGSLFVGLASGLSATLYFWLMQGIQTPLVEVIMFSCWAFIPYYVCDGIEWSGIVAIVAIGFVMDIYIIGHKSDGDSSEHDSDRSLGSSNKKRTVRHGMFSQEGFLSATAKSHIRFVTEINSTLMETAIFSYLGLFLFNKRYHWSFWIPILAIFACVTSRAITVWFFSFWSNVVSHVGSFGANKINKACGKNNNNNNSREKNVVIDSRMQIVLIFAGLRGAMSFALVETIPMFDESTKQGSRFKPELKAMTSACIVFTVFVMGGYTDYLLERVGMKPKANRSYDLEMVSLINDGGEDMETDVSGTTRSESNDLKQRSTASRTIANDDSVKMW